MSHKQALAHAARELEEQRDGYGFHPDTGFCPGVSEGTRIHHARDRKARETENQQWLRRPFIPQGCQRK